MKRLLIMLVLASLVLGLASVACTAEAEDPLLGFLAMVTRNGVAVEAVGGDIFDLGSLGSWNVSYTGAATISPILGTGKVTLDGGYNDNIWAFAYSNRNVDDRTVLTEGDWNYLTPLVKSFDTSGGISKTSEATLLDYGQITARWVRIQHDATLDAPVGTAAIASGTAAMSVSAVPEPGTIVAAMALLAPAGMFFRRKRS